jgi:hypothetical protein
MSSSTQSSSAAPQPAVQLATVLAGAKSFKDIGIPNLGDTYRGQILISPNEVRTAIIKDIPLRELANEVVTAALGSALLLPVPQAYIALAAPGDLATSKAPKLGTSSLLFASTDVSSPSVAQIVVGLDPYAALRRVADTLLKSGRLGSFYGFDAWLANIDRHIGNVLLGPQVYLIDHGRCYTGATWKATDLVASTIFRHRLKEWLTPLLQDAELKKLAVDAAALTTELSKVDIEAIGRANHAAALLGDADFKSLVTFLEDRIVHVPRIAADALNQSMVA